MTTGDEEDDRDLMRSEIEACRAEIVSLRHRLDRATQLAEGWRGVAMEHADDQAESFALLRLDHWMDA